MNTLHDHPSLPIDPDRIFVSLKLADAQRLAAHLEGMTLAKHHEGIALSEVIEMYAPIVEGIRAALNEGQKTAVHALGLSAIAAEDKRRRKADSDLKAPEAKSSLMTEVARQLNLSGEVPPPIEDLMPEVVDELAKRTGLPVEHSPAVPGPVTRSRPLGQYESAAVRDKEKEVRSGTTSRNTG